MIGKERKGKYSMCRLNGEPGIEKPDKVKCADILQVYKK